MEKSKDFCTTEKKKVLVFNIIPIILFMVSLTFLVIGLTFLFNGLQLIGVISLLSTAIIDICLIKTNLVEIEYKEPSDEDIRINEYIEYYRKKYSEA